MKQITLNALLYTEDNDEHFPPCQNWQELVLPYTPGEAQYKAANKELLVCPSSISTSSYAMNKQMGAVALKDLDAPADTILFFESDVAMKSVSGGLGDVAFTRHHGKANFSLADGRVKAYWPRTITGIQWTAKGTPPPPK